MALVVCNNNCLPYLTSVTGAPGGLLPPPPYKGRQVSLLGSKIHTSLPDPHPVEDPVPPEQWKRVGLPDHLWFLWQDECTTADHLDKL